MERLLAVGLLVLISACSGGSTDSNSNETDYNIPPSSNADAGSSHTLQVTSLHLDRQGIRSTNPGTFAHAVSYADFDQDGDVDVFISSGDATENQTPSEMYLNDGAGNFELDNGFFGGSPPGQIHPRKALTGDYNGDGRMDVFVVGHGYDQPPFPGEAPYVILSNEEGFVRGEGLDSITGFHHGGASADIDADGDQDVFVTDISRSFFLINDGTGRFTRDDDRLDRQLENSAMFTAELVDLDEDGFIDLLVGGHEHENFQGGVLWGSSSGYYDADNSTRFPLVADFGTVIDMDVADLDSDGDRDVVLNRTGDGTGSVAFYQGYYIQILEQHADREFADISEDVIPSGNSLEVEWFDWIRLQDFNSDGFVDIVVDDAARNMIWFNDGAGNFTPSE